LNGKFRSHGATYPVVNSEDRYTALEEVQMLLKSRQIELGNLFDILSKSDDSCVDFKIGDIGIQFVRGFGVWSEKRDVIQMTIELQEGVIAEAVAYEYKLAELKRLNAVKLFETDNEGKK
jgi:hypothetical protein